MFALFWKEFLNRFIPIEMNKKKFKSVASHARNFHCYLTSLFLYHLKEMQKVNQQVTFYTFCPQNHGILFQDWIRSVFFLWLSLHYSKKARTSLNPQIKTKHPNTPIIIIRTRIITSCTITWIQYQTTVSRKKKRVLYQFANFWF